MGEKNVLGVKYFHSYVMGEDSSLWEKTVLEVDILTP